MNGVEGGPGGPSGPQDAFAARMETPAGVRAGAPETLPLATRGAQHEEPTPQENRAIEEFEARFNRMAQWAHDVQGQIGMLAEQMAALEASNTAGPVDPLMGYKPSVDQLCSLFAALADWQASAPVLAKNHSAEFATKDRETGAEKGRVRYDYASPGEVSTLARTAGTHGLAHLHYFFPDIVRTYLVHKDGGYVYADVPHRERANSALSPIQLWSAATTAAKRLGILAVLGILPDDTDDAGNPRSDGRSRGAGAGGRTSAPLTAKPPPLPAQNVRRVGGGPNLSERGQEGTLSIS